MIISTARTGFPNYGVSASFYFSPLVEIKGERACVTLGFSYMGGKIEDERGFVFQLSSMMRAVVIYSYFIFL